MIDIIGFDSSGMQTYDTQTERAANILNVQLGDLEYWPEGGIDLRYFLSEPVEFQDASFRAYIIQVLAGWGINVASLASNLEDLFSTYLIKLSRQETSTSLIVR